MKTQSSLINFAALLLFSVLFSSQVKAQVVARFPDGRQVNKDGSVTLPNGQIVKYPKGTDPNPQGYPSNGTRRNDGSVIYPDGTVRYPDAGRRHKNKNWIPPGQAKKRDGTHDAREYAGGHHKHDKKGKKHKKEHDD